ncbi:pseudouridine synthase [Limnospira fusiformis CCALA 023]|jgi:23S rRNA pseudouridine2605 synthase|uniref:Pseudouridine synthase n=1 Tax=Limnospira platensis NIES-46 TaxID=1236695 RepID=A0A5M3TDQ2_LIMPL|nr:pseudouridine synthase [Arthrospira platensis]MDT9294454.1 pseudouridine synthase [Arthrospira platensis PCC 7345]GCE95649.1 putative pseudouridylate synthase [Arthrospira platensis NIES-46]
MNERLQKIISHWGVASRRHAEEMILSGRVKVNGDQAYLGQKADPKCDRIEIDGRALHPSSQPQPLYLLLNKPLGVVSTCAEPQGRKTVLDLLPRQLQVGQGLHPVGRLDTDSTGALLITNDGELTFLLTHPRYHVAKTYQVLVQGCPPESVLEQWRQGILLSGKNTLPAKVRRIGKPHGSQTLLEVVLREGRNRQIRRVAEALGYPVVQLHRTAIGPIYLNSTGKPELASGEYRSLKNSEVHLLKNRVRVWKSGSCS